MAQSCVPFGEAVSQNDQKGDWRKEQGQMIYKSGCNNKEGCIDYNKYCSCPYANYALWYLSVLCSWVECIEPVIGNPVKSHCRIACEVHAEYY